MAQIAANPWLFTNDDEADSVAISSIHNNGNSALVTTSGAHGLTAFEQISIQGVTDVPQYNGGYKVRSILSTTTFLVERNFSNLANSSGSGDVLTAAYLPKLRVEQALWVSPGASATLLITDAYGNQLYANSTIASTGADEVFTTGKLFWVGSGLVIKTLSSGSLQLTIN